MRFATLRMALTAALGWVAVFPAREWLGLPREWLGLPVAISAAALTASAGLAGWIEFLLIRFALQVKIVAFCLGGGRIVAFCAAAIGAAAVALGTKWLLPEGHPVATGAVVLGVRGDLSRRHVGDGSGGGQAAGAVGASRATLAGTLNRFTLNVRLI